MQGKLLALAALAGAAFGQDLTTALSNQTDLSNLTSYLSLFPDFTAQLGQLQNITLVAPNNAAFAAFLNSSAGSAITSNDTAAIQAVFSYHVLNGTYYSLGNTSFIPTALQVGDYANVTGGQRVEASAENGLISGLLANASVVGGPVNFTGGVIHIINAVLTIPQNISSTATELNLTAAVGALINASLAETVDNLGDSTFFIPNNEAFQRIGSALPNLTTEQLTSILTYHVVTDGVFYSTDLSNTTVPTLQGNNLTITVDGEDVFVNSAKVVVPNVLIKGGVVHVIDNVLNPDNSTATSDPTGDDGAPAFSGASSVSDVAYTTAAPTPTGSQATATSSSSGGAAVPLITGAIGAAALFGGAAMVMNI